jgi:hypothetical protein
MTTYKTLRHHRRAMALRRMTVIATKIATIAVLDPLVIETSPIKDFTADNQMFYHSSTRFQTLETIN